MLHTIIRILVLVALGVALYFWSLSPSHDRTWERESTILPQVAIEGDQVTIRNVRDFTYTDSVITDLAYEDRTINASDIEAAYFIIEPFSS